MWPGGSQSTSAAFCCPSSTLPSTRALLHQAHSTLYQQPRSPLQPLIVTRRSRTHRLKACLLHTLVARLLDRYMQGGAMALSRRAAVAAAGCVLGPWRECPNKVFKDVNNPVVNAEIQKNCNAPQTNAEDLYIGVCMKEANMTPMGHPCMRTIGAATMHSQKSTQVVSAGYNAVTSSESKRILRLLENTGHCRCPITVHPLKSSHMLMLMRKAYWEWGCWGKRSAARERRRSEASAKNRLSSLGQRNWTATRAPVDQPPQLLTPLSSDTVGAFGVPAPATYLLDGEYAGSVGNLKSATKKAIMNGVSTVAGCYEACRALPRCGKFTLTTKTREDNGTSSVCALKTPWGAGAPRKCAAPVQCISGRLKLSSAEESAEAAANAAAAKAASKVAATAAEAKAAAVRAAEAKAAEAKAAKATLESTRTNLTSKLEKAKAALAALLSGQLHKLGATQVDQGTYALPEAKLRGSASVAAVLAHSKQRGSAASEAVPTAPHVPPPVGKETRAPHEQKWATSSLERLFTKAFASEGVASKLSEAHRSGRASWLKPGTKFAGASWLLLQGMEFPGGTLTAASKATNGNVRTLFECAHACEERQSDLGW